MDSGKESSSSWNSDKITGRRSAFVTRRKRRKEKGKKKKEIRKSTQREWTIFFNEACLRKKKIQIAVQFRPKVSFILNIFKIKKKYTNIQKIIFESLITHHTSISFV